MKRAIDALRRLIREQEYDISIHANEEMSNDALIAIDIENAILTGKITKRLTKEARGCGMNRVMGGRLRLFVEYSVRVGLE